MHWMVIGAWWVRFNRCQCAYVYVYVSGCLRRFVVDVLKIDFQMRKAANFIQKLISVDKCHTISCSHKNYYYKLLHCTQCRTEFRSISYVTDWRFTPTNFVFGVPHFFFFFGCCWFCDQKIVLFEPFSFGTAVTSKRQVFCRLCELWAMQPNSEKKSA